MTTKKQKEQEQIIETLKFTPRTYTITISGYGGESYAGVVDRKIYDYFKAKKIDICQYAWTWDNNMWEDIPDEMRPFDPGSPYDCDNIWHANGAELSDLNYITVSNENGETHWEQPCGYNLEDHGVTVACANSYEADGLEEGTVVFWAGQGEKGCFFEEGIELTSPFDPKKLTIYFEECDGWSIICGVEYDGIEIDGSGGYSTNGKWSDAKWVIVSDEEVYEGEEREE
jgi:hypothetical protein